MLHSILFEYITMPMGRATADNRLGEREKLDLSRLIEAARSKGFTLTEIARLADVKQPFVSLALRRKLEVRTERTRRLFEYLTIHHLHPSGRSRAHVPSAVLDALAPLLDGTTEKERRVVDVLEALRLFIDA